jgi:hypothetical protein
MISESRVRAGAWLVREEVRPPAILRSQLSQKTGGTDRCRFRALPITGIVTGHYHLL